MSNWQKVAGSRDGGQSLQPPEAIHGLTKENLSRTLPISLSGDPKMVALAESISELLAQRREETRNGSFLWGELEWEDAPGLGFDESCVCRGGSYLLFRQGRVVALVGCSGLDLTAPQHLAAVRSRVLG